jgi:hypothetical protein
VGGRVRARDFLLFNMSARATSGHELALADAALVWHVLSSAVASRGTTAWAWGVGNE